MTYIYAIVFVGILAMFYALGYYLNHKTPLPKECQDLKLECEGCNITSCEVHPVHDVKEEE